MVSLGLPARSRLLSCALLAFFASPRAHAIDEAYDRLVDHYILYTTGSQVDSFADGKGGPGGHAAVYIKGLCKDESVPFPRVKVCVPGEKQKFPHDGVGISVDSQFKNTNVVVVPGREFFMNGELPAGATLDKKEMDRTIQKAIDMGVFDSVELHEKHVPGLVPGTDEYVRRVAELCVGTDFALTYGREMQTLVTPLSGKPEIMQALADTVNARIERFYVDIAFDEKYVWGALSNNCAHLAAKLFSVAGIRQPINQELPMFIRLFHLANPANGIITLNEKTNFRDLDPWTVWRKDKQLREHVMKHGELPIGAGSLVDVRQPVQKNHYFYPHGLKRFTLPPKPVHCSVEIRRRFFSTLKDQRYLNLKDNVVLWQERVVKALGSMNLSRCKGNPACEAFMRKYESVLRSEIPRTDQLLARIEAAGK